MMLDELNKLHPASRSALPQARISEVAKPVAARDSAFAAEHGLPLRQTMAQQAGTYAWQNAWLSVSLGGQAATSDRRLTPHCHGRHCSSASP